MLFELFNQKKKGHKPIPIDLAARIWLNIFFYNLLVYRLIVFYTKLFLSENIHQIASFISNDLK